MLAHMHFSDEKVIKRQCYIQATLPMLPFQLVTINTVTNRGHQRSLDTVAASMNMASALSKGPVLGVSRPFNENCRQAAIGQIRSVPELLNRFDAQ
jgi:hypothetical protein